MNVDRIEEGDIVHININSVCTTPLLKAEVLHTPSATGDSWIFRSKEDGKLMYVSEGCTIILLSKKLDYCKGGNPGDVGY